MDGSHGNYQYRIVEKLGQGGFGYVEKIELFNSANHRCGMYARKNLLGNLGTEQDEFHRRFEREVSYQASCIHENVVNIYLCDLKSSNPWFVMDLADSDLQKDIDNNMLSIDEKISAIDMVLQGVAHIHGKQYLHRDIKPSNVLRFGSSYKVSDFGLVKNLDAEAESEVLTKIATVMGSSKYRAPEVLAAAQYSIRSDIYALGILMEDMDFPDAHGIPDVVRKSTERRPSERYASVAEMREAFAVSARESLE